MIIVATQLTQMLETIEELFNSKYVNDIDFRMNLIYTVGFFFVLESYLRLRKRFALKKGYIPELKGIVTKEEYQKSYDYNMYKEDGHPNTISHKEFAQEIFDKIERQR